MSICKACRDHRCHTELEKRKFHPLMGHGYTRETGWTHPEAERLHNEEQLQAAMVTATTQAREAFRPAAKALPLPPAQIPGTVSNVGGPQ
jgi:hypothetical protein